MKAVYIEKYGDIRDLKVSEIPVPALKAGEVLVKVQAAGVNPSDIGSATGRFSQGLLPRVLGRDFAGKIEEGPPGLVGTEIWGTGGDLGVTRNGTHAEYVLIPAEAAARRPKNLSIEEAATAGVPFVTAYSALFRLGNLKQGEWVIISAAAGAVGQAAIQLAQAKGANIVALLKDAAEQSRFDSTHVHAIALSEENNLNAVVRKVTNGAGADLALNGVGASIFSVILESLAITKGRQVLYSTAGGREYKLDLLDFYHAESTLRGLDTIKLGVTKCSEILNELTPMFESAAIKPPKIGKRYLLAEARTAYESVAKGERGKVVLEM
jgi:NADPH:quinone reductase